MALNDWSSSPRYTQLCHSEQSNGKKTFKDYVIGFVHIDIKYLPQMPDATNRSYLFMAIDRATQWVFAKVYNHHIPQRNLGHISPMQALKNWQQEHPELFKKKGYNQTSLEKRQVSEIYIRAAILNLGDWEDP